MKAKYDHSSGIHVMQDPEVIAPFIFDLLKPNSVVDIGCGLGTFARAFKNLGASEILGVDGAWNDPSLRKEFLEKAEFKYANLEEPLVLDKKYDLVISLEVAEHLAASSADIFIDSLVHAGDALLFSAAVPFQGGQNHINEQWIEYWEEKFNQRGYRVIDFLRPLIWTNPNVYWWYKQNTFVIVKEERTDLIDLFAQDDYMIHKNVIHSEHFYGKAQELYEIMGGRKSIFFYLKILTKGLLTKFGFKFYQNNHT